MDLKYNRDPVCPHCGNKKGDAWEIDFGDNCEGDAEITCGGCEQEYFCERHIEVTYSTAKIVKKV